MIAYSPMSAIVVIYVIISEVLEFGKVAIVEMTLNLTQGYFCTASSLTFWHLLISINISRHTDLDTPLRPPWFNCWIVSTMPLTTGKLLCYFH